MKPAKAKAGGKAVGFRPDDELRQRLEAMAKDQSRDMAHQIAHLVKLGLMVVDTLEGVDTPEKVREALKIAGGLEPRSSVNLLRKSVCRPPPA